MIKKSGIFVFLFLVLMMGIQTSLAEDYRLVPGDSLDIAVYGHEELQVKQLEIRPDGNISFPLVGQVHAGGLTAMELSTKLSGTLVEYVKNPQVTVNVVQFHTIRVYVLGEVAHSGMYEITKQHNLLDAISMAGGYTAYTSKKSVFVVHKTTGDYIQVDLNKMLKKGDLTQNYELGDGDVVYLAKNGLSFFRDILPLLTSMYDIHEISK